MGDAAVKLDTFPLVGKETRGTKGRLPIGLRDWSLAKTTMRKYKINESEVVDETGLPKSTVNRALDYKHFHKCSYLTIIQIRTTIELMLDDAGWPQADDEASHIGLLWSDYDQRIEGML